MLRCPCCGYSPFGFFDWLTMPAQHSSMTKHRRIREGQITSVEELSAVPVGTVIQWINDELGICSDFKFLGVKGETFLANYMDWPSHLPDQEHFLSDKGVTPYKARGGEEWNAVNWIRLKPEQEAAHAST